MKKGFLMVLVGLLSLNLMACSGDELKDEKGTVETSLSQESSQQTSSSEEASTDEGSEEVTQETTQEEEFIEIPIDEEHFPDEAFRERVRGTYDFSKDDGILSQVELDLFDTIKLDADDKPQLAECKSLEGIQYLKTLKVLRINGLENLHEIDLSANTELEELYINNCGIEKLDLSACPNLWRVHFVGNVKLESFILDNPNLTDLRITYCPMKELDFTKCPALSDVYLCNLNIAELDFRDCPDLENLEIWKCSNLEAMDVSKNAKLKSFSLFEMPVKTIDLSNNSALEEFWLDDTLITELDLKDHQQLKIVSCESWKTSKIDIRGCTILTDLLKNNTVDEKNDCVWESAQDEGVWMRVPKGCKVICE